MFKKSGNHSFWTILLILVFVGISSVALADQTEADKDNKSTENTTSEKVIVSKQTAIQKNSQADDSSRKKKLEDAILAGNWQVIYEEAKKWASSQPKSEFALFTADTAMNVIREFDPEFKSLTQYDFPYTDREVVTRLSLWLDDLDPDNANISVIILRATLTVKADGDMAKAIKIFEHAREIAPSNEFILANLANGYGAQGRTNDAKSIFEKILSVDPNSSAAYNGLGMLAMSQRNMSEAERMFKKAVSLKGAGPMEWSNLGSLHYSRKQLSEARIALEKTISLSPSRIDARFNLAGTYHSLGKLDDCIKQLKCIVNIAPESATGKRAKKNLRALSR